MLLFVLDAVIGTGWGQKGETAQSWLSLPLTWTIRNQPVRMIWAMPRASLRSVLFRIAFKAAFTCRVSMQITAKPAAHRPAWSHGDRPPAYALRVNPALLNSLPTTRPVRQNALWLFSILDA